MRRDKGIIAYGTEEDRARLDVLASMEKRSSSDWLVRLIRERYASIFGDMPAAEAKIVTGAR